MRLRAHRRNLVLCSQSASSIGRYGAPPFTRTRWIRVGALLTVAGLIPRARAGRARWRVLLAGAELGVYSHPAQRRLAVQAMDLHYYRIPGAPDGTKCRDRWPLPRIMGPSEQAGHEQSFSSWCRIG
jgi:hypothetical protein